MSRLPDLKIHHIFPELWPFENLDILNLSAIYIVSQKLFELGARNLVS